MDFKISNIINSWAILRIPRHILSQKGEMFIAQLDPLLRTFLLNDVCLNKGIKVFLKLDLFRILNPNIHSCLTCNNSEKNETNSH